MGAREAQRLAVARDDAQRLGAQHHLKPVVEKPLQYGLALVYGGRVHHHSVALVAAIGRYRVGVLDIGNLHALFLQGAGQVGGSAVVAGHLLAVVEKVTLEGCHANAAGAHKIYRFKIFAHC